MYRIDKIVYRHLFRIVYMSRPFSEIAKCSGSFSLKYRKRPLRFSTQYGLCITFHEADTIMLSLIFIFKYYFCYKMYNNIMICIIGINVVFFFKSYVPNNYHSCFIFKNCFGF